jgi:hypothetical protein
MYDLQCLQYKTDQQADLKKLEQLNNVFFDLMSGTDAGDVDMVSSKAQGRARS